MCVRLSVVQIMPEKAGLTNRAYPQQFWSGMAQILPAPSWFILMFGWIPRILGLPGNLFTPFFSKVASWLLQFIMNASHSSPGSPDRRNSRSPRGQRHFSLSVFLSFQHRFVTLRKHEFWIWCTLIDFTLDKSDCPSACSLGFPEPC